MNLELTPGRLLAATLLLLSFWILRGFIDAMLAAGVIAISSWPVYTAFSARLPPGVGRTTGATVFTAAITVLVLAPLVFAGWALLGEARALLLAMAAPGGHGFAAREWLSNAPIIGPWLDVQDSGKSAGSDALLALTRHADPGALLGWAQALGRFTLRQALIVAFAILLLAFFYREGAALERELTRRLRSAVGERADRYAEVATRAIRAAVNSMLVVALFDGLATALAYAIAGAPRALLWAAITGALAAVPFLGYGAVAAMALQLVLQGAHATATLSLLLGSAVLLCGDKLVRPMAARGGMRLPFVWVLMGCIGGFGALGMAGLVIGPVALTLAGEWWGQHIREHNGD